MRFKSLPPRSKLFSLPIVAVTLLKSVTFTTSIHVDFGTENGVGLGVGIKHVLI